VLDRVARLRGTAEPAPGVEPTPAAPQVPTGSVGATIFFDPPTGGELAVRFDARPSAGSLELSSGDVTRASAQVTARASTEALLVLPGELRVRNSPTSAADYRITVPASVRRVRVHIGPGGPPIVVDLPAGSRRAVELAGAR
jgi:hypothetical protein